MSLVKTIQKKTASSKQGAKGIIKGIIACAFQNMAFMLPIEREERNPGLDKMPKEKGQEPAPTLRISPVGACEKGRFLVE